MNTVHVTVPRTDKPDTTVCVFYVHGDPVAQPRGKAVRMGNFVRVVSNPSKHPITSWKEALRSEGSRAMEGRELVEDVALRLELTFLMARPAALTKPKWRERFLLVSNGKDCDNLAKAVQDALNKVIWGDDRIISTLLVRKQYTMPGERPGVRIGVFLDAPEPIPFWP